MIDSGGSDGEEVEEKPLSKRSKITTKESSHRPQVTIFPASSQGTIASLDTGIGTAIPLEFASHQGQQLTLEEIELLKVYERLRVTSAPSRPAPAPRPAPRARKKEGGGGGGGGAEDKRKKQQSPPHKNAIALYGQGSISSLINSSAGVELSKSQETTSMSIGPATTMSETTSSNKQQNGGSKIDSTKSSPILLTKKPAKPLKDRKKINPKALPARSLLDKGELHQSPPSELVVWTGGSGVSDWHSATADGALEVRMPNLKFGATAAEGGGRDTLLVTCSIPADSDTYALNLCPRNHNGSEEIWLHFNPRRRDRNGCVVVDCKVENEWVRASRNALDPLPQLFGLERCQLAFHIKDDRIEVACNGYLFLRFPFNTERQTPPQGENGEGEMCMVAPLADDRGSPYKWTVHSVWWGASFLLRGGGGKAPGVKQWRGSIWNCNNFGRRGGGGGSRGGWNSGRGGGAAADGPRDLHVSGFTPTVEGDTNAATSLQKQLQQLFSRHGAIQIMPYAARGFAFVKFSTHAEARAAMSQLNSAKFMGVPLKISFAGGAGAGGGMGKGQGGRGDGGGPGFARR